MLNAVNVNAPRAHGDVSALYRLHSSSISASASDVISFFRTRARLAERARERLLFVVLKR